MMFFRSSFFCALWPPLLPRLSLKLLPLLHPRLLPNLFSSTCSKDATAVTTMSKLVNPKKKRSVNITTKPSAKLFTKRNVNTKRNNIVIQLMKKNVRMRKNKNAKPPTQSIANHLTTMESIAKRFHMNNAITSMFQSATVFQSNIVLT